MKIDTQHEQYAYWKDIWQRNKDCIDGQDAVKKKRTVYLPKLNGQSENTYDGYLQRAQYTNFSGRTVNISLGQIFRKNPVVENIDDNIYNDVDLSGQSLSYFSRDVAKEVMTTNRCGVLVDWSDNLSRPYLVQYSAFNIINWREEKINGESKLTLVVLEGCIEETTSDPFQVEKCKIWRVLSLKEGAYIVDIYKKSKNTAKEEFVLIDTIVPLINGVAFSFIPFYFVTSHGIKSDIAKSVMYDFCNVNAGHYINSADYENMLHWTGAKTPVLKGWNEGKPIPIGGGITLPVDGDAYFLEAKSDSGLKDEIKRKEEQMAVMGATLISGQGRYVASAETSRINSQGEYATLEDLATALSVSMTAIMKVVVEWQGQNSDNVSVEYNKDFELAKVDPLELSSYMGAVQAGYMSWETFYYNMKNKELYPPDRTMEQEREAIEKDQEVEENEDEQEGIEFSQNVFEDQQEV